MKTILALLFIAFTLSPSTEAETIRPPWTTRSYSERPLPAEWRFPNAPPTLRELQPYLDWPERTSSIKAIIEHFGLPDRFMVAMNPKQDNFLIYNLAAGHTAAFYVALPPIEVFKAGIILDSDKKLLRLIK